MPSRRAVFSEGVSTSSGTVGRSRATRRAVEPELVKQTIAAAPTVRDDLARGAGDRVVGGRVGQGLGEMDAGIMARIGFDAGRDPVHHLDRLDGEIGPRRFPPTA